jgi:hypothetical protein
VFGGNQWHGGSGSDPSVMETCRTRSLAVDGPKGAEQRNRTPPGHDDGPGGQDCTTPCARPVLRPSTVVMLSA